MERSELIQTIISNATLSHRLLQSRFQRAFQGLQLSAGQVHMLKAIAAQQPVNASRLSAQMQLTRGAVSQTIDALLHAGLIIRSTDTSDRRLSHLYVSPTGKERLAQVQVIHTDILSQAMADLETGELETYLNVQRKMLAWLTKNQAAEHPQEGDTSETTAPRLDKPA